MRNKKGHSLSINNCNGENLFFLTLITTLYNSSKKKEKEPQIQEIYF